ncbi:TPA: hypothetical protein ACHVGG_004194, partial [Shigella flexneri]
DSIAEINGLVIIKLSEKKGWLPFNI